MSRLPDFGPRVNRHLRDLAEHLTAMVDPARAQEWQPLPVLRSRGDGAGEPSAPRDLSARAGGQSVPVAVTAGAAHPNALTEGAGEETSDRRPGPTEIGTSCTAAPSVSALEKGGEPTRGAASLLGSHPTPASVPATPTGGASPLSSSALLPPRPPRGSLPGSSGGGALE